MNTRNTNCRAFSLIELVVVIVVFGVLAAMAIPRFSQGAPNDGESDLKTDLAILRSGIAMYYDDHGAYPGQRSAGTEAAGAGTAAAFIRQIARYTDAEGSASDTPSERFCYGPYLQHGVPPCPVSPVGRSSGIHIISGSAVPAYTERARGAGWIYNCETGYIAANSPDQDGRGVRYDTY